MNRYINSADALNTLKHLAYETALNQHDPYVADVFEDIAKNRLETWVDLIPTADVVEVVRCKDCKHLSDCRIAPEWNRICRLQGVGKSDDGYCDEGKRREVEDAEES